MPSARITQLLALVTTAVPLAPTVVTGQPPRLPGTRMTWFSLMLSLEEMMVASPPLTV